MSHKVTFSLKLADKAIHFSLLIPGRFSMCLDEGGLTLNAALSRDCELNRLLRNEDFWDHYALSKECYTHIEEFTKQLGKAAELSSVSEQTPLSRLHRYWIDVLRRATVLTTPRSGVEDVEAQLSLGFCTTEEALQCFFGDRDAPKKEILSRAHKHIEVAEKRTGRVPAQLCAQYLERIQTMKVWTLLRGAELRGESYRAEIPKRWIDAARASVDTRARDAFERLVFQHTSYKVESTSTVVTNP